MKNLIKKSIIFIKEKINKQITLLNLVIFSIVFMALSCILFLWKEETNIIWSIKADKFGQFGDFVGGILGTVFAFLAFYLLYRTYSLQKQQISLEVINKFYFELIEDINSIEYRKIEEVSYDAGSQTQKLETTLYKGVDALYNFDKNHRHSPNSVMNHLSSTFVSFELLIKLIKERPNVDVDFQKAMLIKTYFLFHKKIIWPVYHKIYNELWNTPHTVRWKGVDDTCTPLNTHVDAQVIITKYEELIKDTYVYLLGESLILEPDNEKIRKITGLPPLAAASRK